jgi:uncharacterized protein YbaP (TraB family)
MRNTIGLHDRSLCGAFVLSVALAAPWGRALALADVDDAAPAHVAQPCGTLPGCLPDGVHDALKSVPESGTPSGATSPSGGFREGTLWQLTSRTGASGYVFGTIHIGEVSQLEVSDQVWARLEASRRLVVEVDFDRVSGADLERGRRLPPQATLARALHGKHLRILRDRVARAALPIGDPVRYKPWFLTAVLQTGSHLPSATLDELMIARARRAGLTVVALETPREQVLAFDCIAHEDQLLLLREALATDSVQFERINQDAIDLYRAQRTGDLIDMLIARFPISPEARAVDARQTRCLLEERNLRFADRLHAMLAEPGVFAAIGAGHLVGPGGVLALLAARGFTVVRVLDELPRKAAQGPSE